MDAIFTTIELFVFYINYYIELLDKYVTRYHIKFGGLANITFYSVER